MAPAGGTPQARDPNLAPRSDSSTQGPARHLGSVGGARRGRQTRPGGALGIVSVFSRSPGQGPARRARNCIRGSGTNPRWTGRHPVRHGEPGAELWGSLGVACGNPSASPGSASAGRVPTDPSPWVQGSLAKSAAAPVTAHEGQGGRTAPRRGGRFIKQPVTDAGLTAAPGRPARVLCQPHGHSFGGTQRCATHPRAQRGMGTGTGSLLGHG